MNRQARKDREVLSFFLEAERMALYNDGGISENPSSGRLEWPRLFKSVAKGRLPCLLICAENIN
jgi:hypothetical protein